MYWNDGPRNWKYAVPAALFILLIPVTGFMVVNLDPNDVRGQLMLTVPCGFMFLLFVMTVVNLWKYVSQHAQDMYEQHQLALAKTPLVLLAENMKQMHPEAVKVLNRFGVRTSWQVRVNTNLGTRDWVLADTNVHFGFIEFVLERSGVSLYPKRSLHQGSKKWDPDGIVEDREQYDEFEMWMFSRMMVTRSHGEFKPAEFIPPWTPALILESLGMTEEQDLYRPEETVRVDLGKAAASAQPSAVSAQPAKSNGKPVDEIELTEADLEAIRRENESYKEQYLS
jgi:hypothetical protein